MKKLTSFSMIFFFLIIPLFMFANRSLVIAQHGQPLIPLQAQDALPADWPDEPGAMPELIGGKKADRPMVFIEPATPAESTESVAETTINIWYGDTQSFGNKGNPQEWVNILGNASATTGVKSATYSLNGGLEQALSIGKDNRRLANAGDFNVEIAFASLQSGANTVAINVTDSNDQITTKTVTVNYTPGMVWPETYTANWTTATKISDAAQVVDGKWAINGSGKLYPVEVGYDRLVAMGEMDDQNVPKTWTDYEVTVPIKVIGLDESGFVGVSNGPGIGLITRWQGQTPKNGEQPRVDWERTGGLGWYRWAEKDGAEGLELRTYDKWIGTSTEKVWQFGVQYMLKMSVQSAADPSDTRAFYRLKYWKASEQEPVAWDLKGYSEVGNIPSGSAVLVAHHVDAEFGNVTVTPLKGVTYKLTTGTTGSGTVSVKSDVPGATEFAYGETVRVLATPGVNSILDSWSGDVSLPGTVNPIVLDMTSNINVVANFEEALPGKLTVNVQGQGTVTKNPDKETYAGGEIVTLTANPAPGSIFAEWGGALSGSLNPTTIQINGNKTVVAKFVGVGEASPISDDFNQCELDTNLWTFVNPAGDASYTATGTAVRINVPAGAAHSMWPTVNRDAPRIMQTTKNQDFTVDVKFNSIPAEKHQLEGLLVEQDANNWLRFDIFSDGKKLKMFAGGAIGGNPISGQTTTIPTGGATLTTIYMRVNRVGKSWTQSYSFDGITWQNPQNLSQELTVKSTGIFAGNEPDGSAPAFAMIADYFLNTAFPVGNVGYLLTTEVVGDGTVELDPEPTASGHYGCNQVVTLKAVPGASFTGWSGALSGRQNPATLKMDGNKKVTAHFGKTYALNTDVEGMGQVVTEPDQDRFADGDKATLTAVADIGWIFTGWSGDLTGEENPAALIMNGDKSVTATFVQTFVLNTAVVGNGRVIIDPDQERYIAGDEVTLTAVADTGWIFTGWSGDLTGEENPAALIMNGDKSVTATFVQTFVLNTAVVGNGRVIIDPDQERYIAGDEVTLTAVADVGLTFTGWTGDAGGNINPMTVIMDSDKSISATFYRPTIFMPAVMRP